MLSSIASQNKNVPVLFTFKSCWYVAGPTDSSAAHFCSYLRKSILCISWCSNYSPRSHVTPVYALAYICTKIVAKSQVYIRFNLVLCYKVQETAIVYQWDYIKIRFAMLILYILRCLHTSEILMPLLYHKVYHVRLSCVRWSVYKFKPQNVLIWLSKALSKHGLLRNGRFAL